MTAIYGLTVVGTFAYFLIAACIPIKEDVENGTERRFQRAEKGQGRVVWGFCKGFADYTDIPVVWFRILATIIALPFVISLVAIIFVVIRNIAR